MHVIMWKAFTSGESCVFLNLHSIYHSLQFLSFFFLQDFLFPDQDPDSIPSRFITLALSYASGFFLYLSGNAILSQHPTAWISTAIIRITLRHICNLVRGIQGPGSDFWALASPKPVGSCMHIILVLETIMIGQLRIHNMRHMLCSYSV